MNYFVDADATVRQVLESLNASRKGIVLVVDQQRKLEGTLTDGDVRRAILRQIDLSATAAELLEAKRLAGHPPPVTAPIGTSDLQISRLMEKHSVQQVPLLDEAGTVVDLRTLAEVEHKPVKAEALVLAGGFGKRLLPLTEDVPKPMLQVGGTPVLEHIVAQLKDAGIEHVSLATHFLADRIRGHFGDGTDFGVDIDYVQEESPLGTAGSLGLMKPPSGPVLVINGDIVSEVNLTDMVRFHAESKADITIAVGRYEIEVPYGVVEADDFNFVAMHEKPRLTQLINAGIYIVEPKVVARVTPGERMDMPDLIKSAKENGDKVVVFLIIEFWLDIGAPKDLERARARYEGAK